MRMFGNLILIMLVIFLINRSLIGNAWHEYLGVVFTFFVLVHLSYTQAWLKTLFQGRQSVVRLLNNFVSMLLILVLLTTIISGCLISTAAFSVIKLHGLAFIWAHEIHQSTAYISFILAGIHFGLHWNSIWVHIKKNFSISLTARKYYHLMLYISAGLITVYAVHASFLHHMGDRILMEHMVSIGDNYTPVEYGLDLTMIFLGYAIFAFVLKIFIRR